MKKKAQPSLLGKIGRIEYKLEPESAHEQGILNSLDSLFDLKGKGVHALIVEITKSEQEEDGIYVYYKSTPRDNRLQIKSMPELQSLIYELTPENCTIFELTRRSSLYFRRGDKKEYTYYTIVCTPR